MRETELGPYGELQRAAENVIAKWETGLLAEAVTEMGNIVERIDAGRTVAVAKEVDAGLFHTAARVVAVWETGDLAKAVRDLGQAVQRRRKLGVKKTKKPAKRGTHSRECKEVVPGGTGD
jgi:hypothetical protein